jgi:tetratricopeptide (TPR) repeat protein
MSRKYFPEEHPSVATNLHNLGRALTARGDHDAAEQMFRKALDIRRRVLGTETRYVANTLEWLGNTLRHRKDPARAVEALGESLAITKRVLGDAHPSVTAITSNLASALMEKNDLAEAENVLREAPAMKRAVVGDEYAELVHRMAHVVERRDGARPALEWFQKSLDIRRACGQPENPKMVEYLQCLADAAARAGEAALVLASNREAVPILRRLDPGGVTLADRLASLGLLLLEDEQHAEAEPVLRECLEIRTAKIPDDPKRFNAMSLLGGALLGQRRYEEAEPLLVEGYEKMAADFAPERRRQALERVVSLYETWGRRDKVEAWKAKLAAVGKDD